jgi:hypothetical protein
MISSRRRAVLLAASFAAFVLTSVCQTPKAAAVATASTPALKAYTASDQSASAGVPAGWQVTKGAQTVIQMTGPQGVSVSLGTTVVAQNAAFQLGQKAANGIDLAMPYSATVAQKFTMILQQSAASAGTTASQISVESSTPLQVPATVGQCGRLVVSYNGASGATKALALLCSLPLDAVGTYKNILLYAEAPAAAATAAAPTAQAIFASYRIPTAWLQKKLAPFHAAAPAGNAAAGNSAANLAAAAAMMRSTNAAAAGADVSANCFDLSVLRSTPTRLLPRSCGGTQPD